MYDLSDLNETSKSHSFLQDLVRSLAHSTNTNPAQS